MKTRSHRGNLATIGTFTALICAVTMSAGARIALAAGSASFCEGTIEGTSGTTAPNGHFFSTGTSTTNSKLSTKDCAVATGTTTQVIDGTCTVNDVEENPCVITASSNIVIAQDSNCALVATAEGANMSTPGLAITYATTGPLAGCGQAFQFFPFNKAGSAYFVSVSTAAQVPAGVINGNPNCPVVGSGGIATCVSNPQ